MELLAYLTVMAGFVYRYAWDAPRDHSVEFAVYSHGFAERMPPGTLHYTRYVDDWLLIYFHDSVETADGATRVQVPAGSIMVWAPGQTRIYGHPNKEWTHSWVQITGTQVRQLLQTIGLNSGIIWSAGGASLIEYGLRQLHAEVTHPAKPSARILRNLFENWLLMLDRDRFHAADDANLKLRALKNHLDAHVDAPLSLQAMAKLAGMSPSHLSAVFKQRYEESPGAYHIRRRMDMARYLLANRSLSVSEIADKVGYPELQAFSRMFKRITGVSPKVYREQSKFQTLA